MIRGFDAEDVITPKAGPALRSVTGRPKFGVLNRLKNSARNWILLRSVIEKLRITEKSRFLWFGPRRIPTPQLPNPVPSPIAGGVVNAARLNQPFRRLITEPDDAGFAPVHSARVKPTIFPYTEPADVSIGVMGRPDCSTSKLENCQCESAACANSGPERRFGGVYTELNTKRCSRSKSLRPRACFGFVWSLLRKSRSSDERPPRPLV